MSLKNKKDELRKLREQNAVLTKEKEQEDFTDELRKIFSSKWVENVVWWVFVAIATGVAGMLLDKYILVLFK